MLTKSNLRSNPIVSPKYQELSKAAFLALGLLTTTMIIGCQDEDSPPLSKTKPIIDDPDNTQEIITAPDYVEPEQLLQSITIMTQRNALPAMSAIPVQVSGHYSNGEQIDITRHVEFYVEDDAIFSVVEHDGVVQAHKSGSSRLFASLLGITSDPQEFHVFEGICGGLNDVSKTNATGECIKVIESGTTGGKLYTSTPSVAFLQALGYEQQDDPENSGLTYASSYQIGVGVLENLPVVLSPEGEAFALFRQDGLDWQSDPKAKDFGRGGQAYRYCNQLAEISFYRRDDWRLPTSDELVELYQDYGRVWDQFGFPSSYVYWSSTPEQSGLLKFLRVGLWDGSAFATSVTEPLATGCVSEGKLDLHDIQEE